jgi:hypothetical protein
MFSLLLMRGQRRIALAGRGRNIPTGAIAQAAHVANDRHGAADPRMRGQYEICASASWNERAENATRPDSALPDQFQESRTLVTPWRKRQRRPRTAAVA